MVDTSLICGLLIARLSGLEPNRVSRPSAAYFWSSSFIASGARPCSGPYHALEKEYIYATIDDQG